MSSDTNAATHTTQTGNIQKIFATQTWGLFMKSPRSFLLTTQTWGIYIFKKSRAHYIPPA